MPPEMAVSMRHSKLKASEAALLAGELTKPSWESRNEGIHERVSFEDTIWGFDLAGGSFYKTPLRVTHVKENSRAAKAGIRPGDQLKRINDIETRTLTIQEAHDIIVQSGIHLKIAVTAPEDEEDAYYCYQDEIEDGYDSEEERRREEEKAKKRQVHARVSHYWSLQWPWVSKRRVIYRESNCFLVPSKYEDKHKDKFPPVPLLKTADDVILDGIKNHKLNSTQNQEQTDSENPENIHNGIPNGVPNDVEKPIVNGSEKPIDGWMSLAKEPKGDDIKENKIVNSDVTAKHNSNNDEHVKGLHDIAEVDEDKIPRTPEPQEDSIQEISEADSENVTEESEEIVPEEISKDVEHEDSHVDQKDDDVIHELLTGKEVSDLEEENIINSILSDHEEDSVDER